ncbi:MAG: RluA family pseudouridine synthase [Chloroflexota bacterium]|nr:MAG: RluA family pseudouridine synthase [Chloroflexota bacterium]
MNDRIVRLTYEQEHPQRLDKYLVEQLPEFSRSRLQSLIKEGRVTVDGVIASKSGQSVDRVSHIIVEIPPPQPSELVAEEIALDIVFENDDLLVVNKPAGMVVHPSAGHQSGTLVHAALAHADDIEGVGGVQRPGVVHRLDKDTSGLILMAKNDESHQWLQDQFSSRQVDKVYLALVDGNPPTPRGKVEIAIGRDPNNRKKMAVVPPGKGRAAVSEYSTLRNFQAHTLLEIHPITGRTHQIRVHLAFLKCPVVGDRVYGRRHPSLPLDRQFLHAARLRIRLPGDDDLSEFEAPLPKDLSSILAVLDSSGSPVDG